MAREIRDTDTYYLGVWHYGDPPNKDYKVFLEIHNARIGMVIAQAIESPRGRIELAGGALVIRVKEATSGGPK